MLAILLLAGAARAEEPAPIPAFEPCMNAEIARFERDLRRARSGLYAGLAPFVDGRGVEVCGVGGIVRCDRSAAPLPCQHALAETQEQLRGAVLESLPAPEGPGLYRAVHALAKGRSAGDDCAGMTPVLAAWCAAREATRRAELAVLAYQIARENGAVEPAFRLGWAEAPAPVRPRARGRP
ncbi:hypothetical protein DZK27_04590 [Rhodobacteraceae bacterium 63075]|nr:hypothetical protein DZK27_04590 [Rhodobacteraceae bacterium 63075]